MTADRKGRIRKRRQRNAGEQSPQAAGSIRPGISGGKFRPLPETDLPKIHQAVLHILSRTGLSDAPEQVVRTITRSGGKLGDDGRLTFPAALVEDAVSGFRRGFTLHGQQPGHEMVLSGTRVHMGSGGAAPSLLDRKTGRYRRSTLKDLYDAARLVDSLDNIHFFSRPMVAGDMPDDCTLDINTAYACLSGTTKHVCVSAGNGENARRIIQMCGICAASPNAPADRPFLSFNINHVTPPLRFAPGAMEVMEQAALHGIPAHANIFGQIGASSPVRLAASVAQSMAESLAGGIYAWLINPRAKVIFGPKPMITDLRTGGMSGGGGEQAVAMAAATQLAQYYDLPNVSIAGATDSKTADAQSGYEKCLTVSLAAQAGSNLITQAAGTQASLMGTGLESYVIDNDMLGSVMSSLRPIEVSADSLSLENIDEVVRGTGHFLGEQDTFARMKSDYFYPQVADRTSLQEWESSGRPDLCHAAGIRVQEILSRHYPRHIGDRLDAEIRKRFDIRLARKDMGRA